MQELLPRHEGYEVLFLHILHVSATAPCVAKPQGCGECRKRRSGFLPTSCVLAGVRGDNLLIF
jgi:hypothetical protein